ncbi:MAG: GIY-YIG nuclease family protein [Pseudomonadota bacterium]
MQQTNWFVYILRCSDNSLYTGVTTDCERRLHEHNHSPRGAKFTRARRPVTLTYHEKAANRSEAQCREAQIKRLSAKQKETLIASAPVKSN